MLDRAVTQIVKQGGPSMGPDDNCAYRGKDGRRCSFGACIYDADYMQEMETWDAKGVLAQYYGEPDDNQLAEFADQLQECHDSPAFWDDLTDEEFIADFLQRTKELAAKWGLVHPGSNEDLIKKSIFSRFFSKVLTWIRRS